MSVCHTARSGETGADGRETVIGMHAVKGTGMESAVTTDMKASTEKAGMEKSTEGMIKVCRVLQVLHLHEDLQNSTPIFHRSRFLFSRKAFIPSLKSSVAKDSENRLISRSNPFSIQGFMFIKLFSFRRTD